HVLRGLLAVSLSLVLHDSAGAAKFDDPEAFVRNLYRREVARHNSGGTMSEAEFVALFTRETRQLMQAGRRNTTQIPLGPMLNAFFGWGVLPRRPVELKDVSSFRGALVIVVELAVREQPRRAYVHVIK